MNYIGSKFKLSDFIFESIKERVSKPLNECVFCDLFAVEYLHILEKFNEKES